MTGESIDLTGGLTDHGDRRIGMTGESIDRCLTNWTYQYWGNCAPFG